MSEVRLAALEFSPLDVELTTPFGIATGAQQRANNVLVCLTLGDGVVGYGEAAPFPAVNGETQADVLAQHALVETILSPLDLRGYRQASHLLGEALRHVPSALCGVEIALLDALCRRSRISLLDFYGRAETRLRTDITIVTGSISEGASAAQRAEAAGFDMLKVKVGGAGVDEDARRLLAISQAAPNCRLLLDANGGYLAAESLELLRALGQVSTRVACFEQPTPRDDFEGLAEVERKGNIPVIADESLRSEDDLRALVKIGISGVNIKTAKVGLVRAHDLLLSARALGFSIMVGGMVETEISMGASACLAAGLGGVTYVDLDTPLFMKARPLVGGYIQRGPFLDLLSIDCGHGVRPSSGD